MDGPCSALDPTSTRRVEETIHGLAGQVTVVIVTHDMQRAARVSQPCAFFLAEQGTPGGIVEHGDTEHIFGTPEGQRAADYVAGRFGRHSRPRRRSGRRGSRPGRASAARVRGDRGHRAPTK